MSIIKERLKIIWAWIRCWAFCLWYTPSNKGYCMFSETENGVGTIVVAAVTGSFSTFDITSIKMFYERIGHQNILNQKPEIYSVPYESEAKCAN